MPATTATSTSLVGFDGLANSERYFGVQL